MDIIIFQTDIQLEMKAKWISNFFHDPNLELSSSYETLSYTAMKQTAVTIAHNLTLLNVFASTLFL